MSHGIEDRMQNAPIPPGVENWSVKSCRIFISAHGGRCCNQTAERNAPRDVSDLVQNENLVHLFAWKGPWESCYSNKENAMFYCNTETGDYQWNKPV